MPGDALTLLLVGARDADGLTVRRALRDTAVRAGVEACLDFESALAALQAFGYDCVLVDDDLPGCNGVEMLAAIRTTGSNVPVVVLTSDQDAETAVRLMKAGAIDYVSKQHLTPERLESSLRDALVRRDEEERGLVLAREQQALEEARAANRAKDEFLATLSHELRTPLNAILGWATLLAGGRLDEQTAKRALEIIERNTRTQAQLIDDLLDTSRIITGKLRLECRMVPVRPVLDGALDSVQHAAEEKRISIDIDAGRSGDTLWCDPARMQQVIWNLLSNAIKFTPEGGRVSMRVERDDRDFSVAVSDTGAGIDPAFLPHVFDRFRQQDDATTRCHGGLGLGLSIVRYVIEMHGGTVNGYSKGVGHGATFVVSVPLCPAPTHTDADPRSTAIDAIPQFERIAVRSAQDARAITP